MTAPVVKGIRISHPDRVVYPERQLTKLDVVRYYDAIAPWMLPHVRGRPLTLVHCPNGMNAPCLYLRHSKTWGPGVIRRVRIREKTKVGEYMIADTPEALVALAQMGVLEIHTWNSCADDVERPNRLIWDLDPGPEVPWAQVAAAARVMRDVLATLGLESWLKTTGGHGLHVVVPVAPRRDWSECLEFARGLAQAVERADPGRFTTAFAKQGREARILIDYLRNNRTNTSVSAFSTRARTGAPVSMPLAWSELGPRRRDFPLTTVRSRLARQRTDPWEGYWTCRQRIRADAFAALRSV